MSRSMEVKLDGELNRTIIETIESMDECKHLINDVCTEPECDACCDFPSPEEYCSYCRYYEKEDGVIREE